MNTVNLTVEKSISLSMPVLNWQLTIKGGKSHFNLFRDETGANHVKPAKKYNDSLLKTALLWVCSVCPSDLSIPAMIHFSHHTYLKLISAQGFQ